MRTLRFMLREEHVTLLQSGHDSVGQDRSDAMGSILPLMRQVVQAHLGLLGNGDSTMNGPRSETREPPQEMQGRPPTVALATPLAAEAPAGGIQFELSPNVVSGTHAGECRVQGAGGQN